MKLKVRGKRVVWRHNYTPRWLWIIILIVSWNLIIFGMFIEHPLSYTLIVLAVLLPLLFLRFLTTTYIVTDKEIVVVKRGKIVNRLDISRGASFRATSEKIYIFSFGQPVGNIEVYGKDPAKPILIIKNVRSPRERVKYLNEAIYGL
ncbi:MAG: hypothetical protein DRO15_00850 [Thermoprotei archaeon]|nr:MAG: hypothetical protein DRO15_00850 [Thermoprotei archaeon]